jgi:beta-galactosidase
MFEIVDSAGTVVPTADNLVSVTVTGGRLLVLDNSDLRVHSAREPGMIEVYNGRGLAILKATDPGVAGVASIEVTVTSPGLQPATVSLTAIHGVSPPSIPAAK